MCIEMGYGSISRKNIIILFVRMYVCVEINFIAFIIIVMLIMMMILFEKGVRLLRVHSSVYAWIAIDKCALVVFVETCVVLYS